MTTTAKVKAARKPAFAGEAAGYSLDEMIQMLESGLAVDTLLCLIEWRLRLQEKIRAVTSGTTSAQIM
jgi:hypothetical protein